MKKEIIKQLRWSLDGKDYEVNLIKTQYINNGRVALALETLDGQPFTVLSVNFVDVDLANDEIAIKDYAENEGALMQLILNGIVTLPYGYIESGYVKIPVVKILI